MHALLARWAPDHEKASLTMIMTMGQDFGLVFAPLVGPALLRAGGALRLFGTWAMMAVTEPRSIHARVAPPTLIGVNAARYSLAACESF